MNHDPAAAKPHSLPAGGAGEHRDLGREVSETRAETRTLGWASALAFVAIVGTMGFFYKALESFNEGLQDVRQSLGAIYQQTITLGERLDRQDERLNRMDERLDRQDERLRHVENGLVEVNGRLDRQDGRLANVEELLRVLVARSAAPS